MSKAEDRSLEIAIVIAIIALGFFFLGRPYFEMRSFNKFSEKKATYWDAVWTQLRVTPD